MDDLPPPWVAVPGLTVDDPTNQGLAEAFITLNWLPFWQALTSDEKARYLDRWSTTPEWREAIAFRFDHKGYDAEADALEADEWAKARQQTALAAERRSVWDRLKWVGRRPRHADGP